MACGCITRLLVVLNDEIDRGRQKGKQEIGSLRCCARSTHDGAAILAQHFQPRADVVGMAHGRHDTERCADERARNLGDLS